MKLGIHFVNFTLREGAAVAGADPVGNGPCRRGGRLLHVPMMDHWFQMEQFATSQDPMLEGYTSLGFLAGLTQTMTLGLLVTGVTYRHPGLLAKIVTTLDVLSEGPGPARHRGGVVRTRARGLGVPFPPVERAVRAPGGDLADLSPDVE